MILQERPLAQAPGILMADDPPHPIVSMLPDPSWIKGRCPSCGAPLVDNTYYQDSRGLFTLRQCWNSLQDPQECDVWDVAPPPAMLKEYNEAAPDAGDRILKMAEAQQAHRLEMDRRDARRADIGQVLAFVLAFGGGGLDAILHGQPVADGTLAGATLLSLVYAFIRGNAKKE